MDGTQYTAVEVRERCRLTPKITAGETELVRVQSIKRETQEDGCGG